ncbi:hypothetical protein Glove_305g16 [Diversispora epigaea]|uniref:Uncharacterized protein n=1 Tax=Diversispora epigaea TaxID=1348612 RepID=A0A397HUA1_9GLOM|nr:hypothetical protein Glove_305g16 [Diversispora epigaea]
MDRMKLINLLNKEKVILKYNNKDYIIYYQPIINCIKNILSINDIHNNITFNFKNDQSNNNRNYNEQYTANWWTKTEKTIPLGSHLFIWADSKSTLIFIKDLQFLNKTDNESDESEESKGTETIPKFPNNTYSDLMTLIIQHNLNNKAGNAIIQQGRKLMDRMKLINLLNKEKVILKYNNKDYIIYYQPIINCIKNILSINDIHNNITFNFKNDQSNNNRNYNEQYTANWWTKTEKTIPLGSHLFIWADSKSTLIFIKDLQFLSTPVFFYC